MVEGTAELLTAITTVLEDREDVPKTAEVMTAAAIKLEAGTDSKAAASKSVPINEVVPAGVGEAVRTVFVAKKPHDRTVFVVNKPAALFSIEVGTAKETRPRGELSKPFLVSSLCSGADYWSFLLSMRRILEWLDRNAHMFGAQWEPGARFWSSDSVPF